MATVSLPVQVIRGLYLGVLTGIVPALVAWALGFLFRYVTGITAPSFGIVVLGVAIAGVNGGFLAFNDPAIIQSANSVTLVTALLVIMMGCFYAHNRGDALGAKAPRRISLRTLRERTLSADVITRVGGRGEVLVRVTGQVKDMEGHPPLPESLRETVAEFEARLPADLPVTEIETRFSDRLKGELDLGALSVEIDEHGRATVAAAPSVSGVSKRVSSGERAVSIRALLPTGLDRGDEVTIHVPTGTVDGKVVSAGADGSQPSAPAAPPSSAPDGETEAPVASPELFGTRGGMGRVTVAVDRGDADPLLSASEGRIVVTARGTARELELVSVLRRAGGRLRRLTVGSGSKLAGQTLRAANVRAVHGVGILAVEHDGRWQVAPGGDTVLEPGVELYVAGPRDAVATFAGVLH